MDTLVNICIVKIWKSDIDFLGSPLSPKLKEKIIRTMRYPSRYLNCRTWYHIPPIITKKIGPSGLFYRHLSNLLWGTYLLRISEYQTVEKFPHNHDRSWSCYDQGELCVNEYHPEVLICGKKHSVGRLTFSHQEIYNRIPTLDHRDCICPHCLDHIYVEKNQVTLYLFHDGNVFSLEEVKIPYLLRL